MALDPNEFAALTRNAETYYGQTAKKSAPKKKGNFLTGILPSVTGTAGGAGGAFAGAALGTAILPGVGTAAGGLLGALLGGGAGGAAGKVGANALNGEALGNGVAKEAALNGVLSAGPLRLLKGAAVAGKAATTGGRSLAEALGDGAVSAAGPSLIKKTVSEQLGGVKGSMANKALGLTKGQKNTILEKTGEKSGDIAVRYGIKNAEDIPTIIKPLYQEFDDAVKSIPGQFTMRDLQSKFAAIYSPLLAKGAPLGQQAMGKQLKAEADNLIGSMNGTITAAELNAKRQAFDKLAYSLKGTDPTAANVNKQARDVLSNLVQDAANKAGIKTASGRTIKETGREINKLERLSKAAGKNIEGTGGSTLLGGIGTLPGAVLGSTAGPGGAALGIGANMVLNSSAGRQAVARGTDVAAQKVAQSAAKNPYGLTQIGKRVAPVGLVGALGQSSSTADSTDSATSANTINTNTITNEYDPTGEIVNTQSDSPFAPENAQANIQQILAGGGTIKDVKEYVGLVQALAELAPATTPTKPMSAEASKVVSNANSGLTSLAQLEQSIGQNGVPKATVLPGRGLLGGLAGNALGTAGYDQASRNVLDVITRLRTGAALTESEERFYKSQLPQAFDSPEVVAQKLATFRDLFSSVAERTTGNGAEDLLSQLQGAR